MGCGETAGTSKYLPMNDLVWFAVFALWPVGCGGLLFVFAKYWKPGLASRRWVQLGIGNALVLLWLVSVAFLGGETYYRFFYDTTDAFGYTKTSLRWVARHVQLNAQWVRDNINYEADIPPGKRRISFLGDSFTAGHGVENVDDRFVNRIRRARPDWEVHAAAESGADTGAEQQMLKALAGFGYECDQVVLVYCLNDLSDIVPEWNDIYARIFADRTKQNWLVRNSYFANILYYRLKARRDPAIANYYHFLLPAYRGPLWEEQKRRLKAIRDDVESHGGHLRVVTFPFLHAPLDDTYEYRFVHEQLETFWRELKVPCLDLLPVYQGQPPRKLVVNRFDAHPNEFAHQLAAEAIRKFLEQNISARPGP
jgi:hypothetical protein